MERGIRRQAGVVMLVWETDLPCLPEESKGERRIAAFYQRLSEEATALIDRLDAAAREEYAACDHPRKRFTFPFYRLSLSVTVSEQGATFFSARRRLTLQRGGRTLAERNAAELFLRRTGVLCTRTALRLRSYRIPKGKGDLYMEGGILKRL